MHIPALQCARALLRLFRFCLGYVDSCSYQPSIISTRKFFSTWKKKKEAKNRSVFPCECKNDNALEYNENENEKWGRRPNEKKK